MNLLEILTRKYLNKDYFSAVILCEFVRKPDENNNLVVCNTCCATATRAVPLQQGYTTVIQTAQLQHSCNTGCAAASQAMPLQHVLCHCNTAVPLQQGYTTVIQTAQLQHSCNTGSAAASRAMPLQNVLCRCTKAIPLQTGLCTSLEL